MPRTGRGGARQGRPGQSYANRTDLNTQPVRTGPSQAYGQRAELERAQQALPLPAAGTAAPQGAGGGVPAAPPPGFNDPAPGGGPITAGLSSGAGAGPSGIPDETADPVAVLRAIYASNPNEGLRRYLTELGLR